MPKPLHVPSIIDPPPLLQATKILFQPAAMVENLTQPSHVQPSPGMCRLLLSNLPAFAPPNLPRAAVAPLERLMLPSTAVVREAGDELLQLTLPVTVVRVADFVPGSEFVKQEFASESS